MSHPSFVVVEGPIGVGKTTLAKRLAEDFGTELLLEMPEENPFLERFYASPEEAAFPTQLFFLMQRMKQMQELRQGDLFAPVRVADFLMAKDYLFARLTLQPHELELYEQVYQQLTVNAPVPDLVVYLQAPVTVLQERIGKRGRDYERHITTGYLERLVDGYMSFFHQYDESPLLIVNAAEIDFAHNEDDYRQLFERIGTVKHGRHFYNPLPFELRS